MFQWRFEGPILAKQKRSTIRLKARCQPGNKLSLRRWQDKPYRSKQCLMCEVTCSAVSPIRLGLDAKGYLIVIKGGEVLSVPQMAKLAKLEGFHDLDEMREWFERNHMLRPGDDLIQCEQIEW